MQQFAPNFKFWQLLDASWLSDSEKYDIWNIFSCLSDDRKVDIITHWERYLWEILKIRRETQDKRRENIYEALRNINHMIDEAMLRKKDEDEKKRKEMMEHKDALANADYYDRMRKANNLQNLIKKQNEWR